MLSKISYALILLMFLIGCNKSDTIQPEKTQLSKNIADAKKTTAPIFQIRDWSIKDTSTVFGNVATYSFEGEGTIVVTSPEYQKGNLILIISCRDKSEGSNSNKWTDQTIFIKDGYGTIKLHRFDGDKQENRPNYEWKIVGWTDLREGKLEVVD